MNIIQQLCIKCMMAGTFLIGISGVSAAMDVQTLVDNASRYRVVETDDNQVVFADFDSIISMQTRDNPSTIENVKVKLYVENYKDFDATSPLDWQNGTFVVGIDEYDGYIAVNKNTKKVNMTTTLKSQYTGTMPANNKNTKDCYYDFDAEAIYRNIKNYELRTANKAGDFYLSDGYSKVEPLLQAANKEPLVGADVNFYVKRDTVTVLKQTGETATAAAELISTISPTVAPQYAHTDRYKMKAIVTYNTVSGIVSSIKLQNFHFINSRGGVQEKDAVAINSAKKRFLYDLQTQGYQEGVVSLIRKYISK
ncbi:MAG: hypothetical protein LKI17_07155 [Megasphaera cerevisiae]|nr:hypothetical protein [Megasphaera cerevisiae]